MADPREKTPIILKDKDKSEIISNIHAARGDYLMTRLVGLLDILISDTRKENDTVSALELPKNQGKIEGFKELKNYIENGLPGQRF